MFAATSNRITLVITKAGYHPFAEGCYWLFLHLKYGVGDLMKRMTNSEFISLAKKVHGNRYSYENTEYTGTMKKVIITCDTHGDFILRASKHTADGHGCKKCTKRTASDVSYNAETGLLVCTKSGAFLYAPRSDGYLTGEVDGITMLLHRLAWEIYHNKKIPNGLQIDHVNGVRDDNRICNLRLVSRSGNMRNRATPKNNTSGQIGVHYSKGEDRWIARIGVKGRKVAIGAFIEKSDAIAARKLAEAEYGFHKNHGRMK